MTENKVKALRKEKKRLEELVLASEERTLRERVANLSRALDLGYPSRSSSRLEARPLFALVEAALARTP